ncbi:uncharacterized protein LOC130589492 [Beta vulgaris subsp. vulgaris]|uniref:uncharacterized protein LOC130589492 n=1 Tax=Beta vulgaris subsp. vulgaris TaxID=3555 RepID=UPI0025486311|nr:uncharacterized protein LOC130589492 [Beta vulgaris subsp. vulgaris]
MKHKSESFDRFKEFQSEVKNQLAKTIKALRSDHGLITSSNYNYLECRFLSDESERTGDSNIGFMCPSMISETMLRHEPDAAINYMQRTLRTNRNMKFIMLPYIESQHWILLVLSLHKKTVYVFDSLRRSDRSLAIKEPLHTAYTSFLLLEGMKKATKLSWISMKCAQQTGGDECGYFVMKNMFQIVRYLYESNDLKKVCML